MGRSLQLLAQVGSPQFAKCVSPPSLFLSSSAPLLWMPTSTRKSVKSNVVVSLKDSAHTTGRALLPQLGTDTGLAMTAMTDSTIAHAEHTTTTRERQMLTPSMATMDTIWGTPMETAWGMPMDRTLAT